MRLVRRVCQDRKRVIALLALCTLLATGCTDTTGSGDFQTAFVNGLAGALSNAVALLVEGLFITFGL
jgi:hypothetical protein